MSEVLSFPSDRVVYSKAAPSPMPLKVEQLFFDADHTRILSGVDLDLSSDALTVLMGPNGAGKSVFLRLIHGLLTPTAGQIFWNGKPLTKEIRRRQAMVFQKPVLLRRSVKANLNFALGLRKWTGRNERLATALAAVGLSGLEDRPARVLSGGEQQRLALARALVLQPKVLLLDEPTANLDPASVLLIEDAIRTVRKSGVKVILVTHDQHQAQRLGEEVAFLHRGRIVEHSPADRFFDHPDTAAARAYLRGEIII